MLEYEKLNWQNKDASGNVPDGAPALSALSLNHMDNGIGAAVDAINGLEADSLKMQIGTYVGDNARNRVVECVGAPLFILVQKTGIAVSNGTLDCPTSFFAIKSVSRAACIPQPSPSVPVDNAVDIVWQGKNIQLDFDRSYDSSNKFYHFNKTNETYTYMIIYQ